MTNISAPSENPLNTAAAEEGICLALNLPGPGFAGKEEAEVISSRLKHFLL